MTDAFLTGFGRFLPGAPVGNDRIQDYIGEIDAGGPNLRDATLQQNGVQTRYYAIDESGVALYSNARMAANAVRDALDDARRDRSRLELLATATTQGDLLVPGFASAVHAELGAAPLELASFQSVCSSALMALKTACLNVRAGEVRLAAVSGSEFSSRWFQPEYYRPFFPPASERRAVMELEFLRWTLSDGAGAVIVEPEPRPHEVSLRIDWIELRSFADRFGPCMYAGAPGNQDSGGASWGTYSSPREAYEAGALVLRQDFDLLYRMFPVWVGYFLELLDKHGVSPESVDYFLPHYSARSLGEVMKKLLRKSGAMIPEERWHNNLAECGNTGSASIFIMLQDLMHKRKPRPGETVLCFVPESGRCIASFMHLSVV